MRSLGTVSIREQQSPLRFRIGSHWMVVAVSWKCRRPESARIRDLGEMTGAKLMREARLRWDTRSGWPTPGLGGPAVPACTSARPNIAHLVMAKLFCILTVLAVCAPAQTVEGSVIDSARGDGVAGVTVEILEAGTAAYFPTPHALATFRLL